MQIGTVATRIETACLTSPRRISAPRITVRDERLRGFSALETGIHPAGLAPQDFACGVNGSNELLHVISLSNNTLRVRYASLSAPFATGSWSTATFGGGTPAARYKFGVALWVSGTSAQVYWIDHTDGKTIRRATSSDGGHTFSAAATVVTLSDQVSGAAIMLSAPAQDVLFATDTSSGQTVIRALIYSGGSWSNTTWDLGGLALGVAKPVSYFGQPSVISTISAVQIGTDYLLTFYADQPRGHVASGIYAVRVNFLSASNNAPPWGQLIPIYTTNPNLSASSTSSPLPMTTMAFPKIMAIGSEYWILATEMSNFRGTLLAHLAFFKSNDGSNWSERDYLIGTDYTYTDSQAYSFDAGQIPFAQPLVSGNNFVLAMQQGVVSCPATMKCGVDNAAMKLDISANVVSPLTISYPSDGQAATVTLNVKNPGGVYTRSNLLRRGARITIEEGMYTSQNADEYLTVGTFLVDQVQRGNAIQGVTPSAQLSIVCRDWLKRLDRKVDTFTELKSPDTTHIDQFNDLTSFEVFSGNFFASGGTLHGAMIDPASNVVDNLAVLQHLRGEDGLAEIKFKVGDWTNAYTGLAFQIKSNTDYYAAIVDGTTLYLYKANAADPSTTTKMLTYTNVASVACALTAGTVYWLRVQLWHGKYQILTSSDHVDWTVRLSGTGLPCEMTTWGVVVKGTITLAPALGNTLRSRDVGAQTYGQFLQDGNSANKGGAFEFCQQVTAIQSGKLKSVVVNLIRYEINPSKLAYVPDVVVSVYGDTGSNFPDPTNVLFTTTVSPSTFPNGVNQWDALPWTAIQANGATITAGNRYWIAVKSAADITLVDGQFAANPMWLNYVAAASSPYLLNKFRYHSVGGAWSGFYPTDATSWDPLNSGGGTGGQWSNICAYLDMTYDSSGVTIYELNHTGGETVKTVEDVARAVAGKATLAFAPDNFLNDGFTSLDTGADGTEHVYGNNQVGTWAVSGGELLGYNANASAWALLRTNTFRGLIADTVFECDVTLLANDKRAGWLWRATDAPSAFTAAYLIDLQLVTGSPNRSRITLSKIITGTLTELQRVESLVPIYTGTKMRARLATSGNVIWLYLNDALAAVFFDAAITARGSVGFAVYGNISGGAVARFDNARVPDVRIVRQNFAVEAEQPLASALSRALGKDRLYTMARYDGALRLASFAWRQTLGTTLSSTLKQVTETDSDRDLVSHLRALGERSSERWEATLLDSDGRRYDSQDYTDAYTNDQAYDDAVVPLTRGRELADQLTLSGNAILTLEREDLITYLEPTWVGGVTRTYIVNNLEVSYEIGNDPLAQQPTARLDMVLGLRRYVPITLG